MYGSQAESPMLGGCKGLTKMLSATWYKAPNPRKQNKKTIDKIKKISYNKYIVKKTKHKKRKRCLV